MSAVSRVKKALGCLADSVSKRRDGSIVIKCGFHYRHGLDADDYRIAVTKKLNECDSMPYSLKDWGEHFIVNQSIHRDTPLSRSSHWFVEIWPEFT